MPRTKTSAVLTLRVELAVERRLVALVKRFEKASDPVTKSDLMRSALLIGLVALESRSTATTDERLEPDPDRGLEKTT